MNFKSIFFYTGLFCFPISLLSFINILYSSYFDFFLSIESYFTTLILSLFIGSSLFLIGKKSNKKLNFIEQLILIILVYILIGLLISIPFYLSTLQFTFISSFFESISGLTGTGFSSFENINATNTFLIYFYICQLRWTAMLA